MLFKRWLKTQPHGVKMRIVREAKVSPTTVAKVVRGEPLNDYEVARRISEATQGEVSAAELCEPSAPVKERAVS